jgi:hypothetical protein
MLTFVRKQKKTEVMVQKDRYIRFDWAVKVRHEVLMLIV